MSYINFFKLFLVNDDCPPLLCRLGQSEATATVPTSAPTEAAVPAATIRPNTTMQPTNIEPLGCQDELDVVRGYSARTSSCVSGMDAAEDWIFGMCSAIVQDCDCGVCRHYLEYIRTPIIDPCCNAFFGKF